MKVGAGLRIAVERVNRNDSPAQAILLMKSPGDRLESPPLTGGADFQAGFDHPGRSVQPERLFCGGCRIAGEDATLDALHDATVAAHRTFVVQIVFAMIRQGFGGNHSVRARFLQQPPRPQSVSAFEHEIPMRKRVVVREDHETRHGSTGCSGRGRLIGVGVRFLSTSENPKKWRKNASDSDSTGIPRLRRLSCTYAVCSTSSCELQGDENVFRPNPESIAQSFCRIADSFDGAVRNSCTQFAG